jgi:release factor glutamine methyltransferase
MGTYVKSVPRPGGAMDVRTTLNDATLDLEHHGSPTARLDAEVLLSHCIKMNRLRLYTHPEATLTESDLHSFQCWVARRCAGEPVAYIIGQKEFWSLLFEVNRDVLIPRPETELLVETIVAAYSSDCGRHLNILEIGTGSGAIAVALASELKNANIVATDISQDALGVAMRNARNNGVDDRISFVWGSLFEPVCGKFDVIASNPPYIREDEFELLPIGVRGFEPRVALAAGMEGTQFHRDIIMDGACFLKREGRIFLEIGAKQASLITDIMNQSDFYEEIAVISDYACVERLVRARRKGEGTDG